MSRFEKFSNQEVPENVGVEKLYKFLARSGFIDVVSDLLKKQYFIT